MPSNLGEDTGQLSKVVRVGYPAMHSISESGAAGQDTPGTLSLENSVEKINLQNINKREDSSSDSASTFRTSPFPDDENERSMGRGKSNFNKDMLNLAQQQVDKLDDIYGEIQKNSILLQLIFQSMGEGVGMGGSEGGEGGISGSGGGGFGLGGILGAVGLGAAGGSGLLGGIGAFIKKLGPKLLLGGEEFGAVLGASMLFDYMREKNHEEILKSPDPNESVLDQAKQQIIRKQRLDLSNGRISGIFQNLDNDPQSKALRDSVDKMEKLNSQIESLKQEIQRLDGSINKNSDEVKRAREKAQEALNNAQTNLDKQTEITKDMLPDTEKNIQDQIEQQQQTAEKFGITHGYVSPLPYLRSQHPGGFESGVPDSQIGSGPFSRTFGGRSRGFGATLTNDTSGEPKPASGKGIGTKQQRENSHEVYNAFIKAGFTPEWSKIMTGEVGRENAMNPRFLYGTHIDDANGKINMGMFSWQGQRGENLRAFMKQKGLLDDQDHIKPGQASLDAMAQFAKHEIDTTPAYEKTREAMKANPNPDYNQGADTVGRNYVGWAIDNPKYRASGLRNRAYFAGMVGPGSEYNPSDLDNHPVNQPKRPYTPTPINKVPGFNDEYVGSESKRLLNQINPNNNFKDYDGPNIDIKDSYLDYGGVPGDHQIGATPQIFSNKNKLSPLLTQESNKTIVDGKINSLTNQFTSHNNIIQHPHSENKSRIAKDDKKPERPAPPDDYLKQLFTPIGQGGIGHA